MTHVTLPLSDIQPKKLNPSALRAYDIRGEVGSQITIDDAYYIGRAFATKVIRKTGKQNPEIAVGFDGRLTSPALRERLAHGILDAGANIIGIEMGPSPMLYFTVRSKNLDGGIMITASHNPKNHNGFKMMYSKAPIFGAEIQELGRMCETADFVEGKGIEKKIEIKPEYIKQLSEALSAIKDEKSYQFKSKMKIAWDPGNGAGCEIISELVKKFPGTHILINEKVDGNFPAHHPDPTVAENLQQLIEVVKKEKCDIGIAFDGDADRIGAVDGKGRIIWGDQLMTFFADDVISENKGAKIIADVKASQTFFDKVKELGGEPIMWKTGHSYIKQKLAETGALLAGEMSGHVFFADKNYGYDDAIYAAVRLINYFAKNRILPNDAVDKLPKSFASPEYRITVPEADKVRIVEEIRAKVFAEKPASDINEIDGIRIREGGVGGWWILRASNTQSAVTIRAESTSEAGLQKISDKISSYLKIYNLKLALEH